MSKTIESCWRQWKDAAYSEPLHPDAEPALRMAFYVGAASMFGLISALDGMSGKKAAAYLDQLRAEMMRAIETKRRLQ